MSQTPKASKGKKQKPSPSRRRGKRATQFKVGRVCVYLRGKVWYIRYHQHGKRYQKKTSPDKENAKQIAAETNAQLECHLPTAFGFEQISLVGLRRKWLDYHEDIKRSSLATIDRYRSATVHLIAFAEVATLKHPSELIPRVTEDFVRYLRGTKVAPNGHANTAKRPLRDSGVKFILQICSAMINYAKTQRHLPPYYENPFATTGICNIPVEDAKKTFVFSRDEERRLLAQADPWLLPIMVLLLQTGMRPQEVTRLLVLDIDLEEGWVHIRNKKELGWMVKTRRERSIPITPELTLVLRSVIDGRPTGPVFRQRRCSNGHIPPFENWTRNEVEAELSQRADQLQLSSTELTSRLAVRQAAKTIWRDWGAVKYDYLRHQFKGLMKKIERPDITTIKTCRHNFATCLQDANVDPLIRNELLGHSPAGLGMTTRYTQTRPETKRKQLLAALEESESSIHIRNCYTS